MYTNTPETLGVVLVELATVSGYPSEGDLFITQAVLQLVIPLKLHPLFIIIINPFLIVYWC